MSTEVKKGDILDLTNAKYGTNRHGSWLLVKQKPQEGNGDAIDVFISGSAAEDAKKWDTAKVKEITRVRRSARTFNGKWYQTVAVDVNVTQGPAKSLHERATEFLELPPDSLEDLPFA